MQPIKKILELANPVSTAMAAKITPEMWDLITGRQQTFSPHRETKSIFLRSVPDPSAKVDADMFFETGHMLEHDVMATFKTEVDSVLAEISNIMTIEEWAATLIMLPAGKEVYKHKDVYPHPENIHRIHIPIQTNSECFWYGGKLRTNMKLDTLYEVRNLEYEHYVKNGGTTDRIHFIIDIAGDYI